MKRVILSVVMAAAIVTNAFAAASSGNCGPGTGGVFSNTCTWKIDTVMHYQYGRCPRLTISGTGSTADFNLDNPWPWWESSSSIKLVEIKAGVTRVGGLVFANMTSLREVIWGSTVTELGNGAFYSCSSIQVINLPTTMKTIGWAAFESCSALTTINATNSTYFYSDNGVLYTYNKKELIRIPIASAITDYTILPEATTLRERSISDMSNLTTLRLHKGITDYQNDCLMGNSSSITDIYAPFAPVRELPEKAISGFKASTVNLHVPNNFKDIYAEMTGWKNFNIVSDLSACYDNCIFIGGKWCQPDANGVVTSPKITDGTVMYMNKVLALDNATVEGPILADVQFVSVAGECTISSSDDNALHLYSEVPSIAIFGASGDAHLIIKVTEPSSASLKPVALYSKAPSMMITNSLAGKTNSLGITIETRRIGIDAASSCEVQLDKGLRFVRIRPEASSAFKAFCYSSKITVSLFGSGTDSGTTLSDQTNDADGNCLWEQTVGSGLKDVEKEHESTTKVLRNGILFIEHNGKTVNVLGQPMK